MVCGYIYPFSSVPEVCLVCNSKKEKLKRIDSKLFINMEDFDIPKRKKKYRRVFKKGFTRKYKKFRK